MDRGKLDEKVPLMQVRLEEEEIVERERLP
jgi:hypothetical protein